MVSRAVVEQFDQLSASDLKVYLYLCSQRHERQITVGASTIAKSVHLGSRAVI